MGAALPFDCPPSTHILHPTLTYACARAHTHTRARAHTHTTQVDTLQEAAALQSLQLTTVHPHSHCNPTNSAPPQVDTLEEAIALVNANKHGNGTAVFTASGAAARKFQSEIDVGMVGALLGGGCLCLGVQVLRALRAEAGSVCSNNALFVGGRLGRSQ